MINRISSHHIPSQQRFQAGALKVFEETNGATNLIAPGLEDRYEDLAADFLEQWLVSSSDSSVTASGDTSHQETSKKEQPQMCTEPQLTQFSLGLDWNLAG